MKRSECPDTNRPGAILFNDMSRGQERTRERLAENRGVECEEPVVVDDGSQTRASNQAIKQHATCVMVGSAARDSGI